MMFKVKAFKDINTILGVLSGELSKTELNTFGNEVVRTIENKLASDFTYMLDISKFESNWHNGDHEVDDKMKEICHFLKMMGLKETYIIGASRPVYDGVKGRGKKKPNEKKTIFFANLDEALAYLGRNK